MRGSMRLRLHTSELGKSGKVCMHHVVEELELATRSSVALLLERLFIVQVIEFMHDVGCI